MKWRTVALTDICRPRQWKTIPTSVLTETGYPVFGANGIIGFYPEYNHEKPTVVITCRGATCGTVGITLPKSYITGNAMALDELDEDQVDQKFLYYQLSRRGFRDVISGTAQPQITGQGLAIVKIDLPPLPEQKRIAAILDKAEAIRRKREKAVELADAFLRSVFLEMFGDPVQNPKSWDTVKGTDLFKELKYGTSEKCSETQTSSALPVLRIPNVLGESVNLEELKYADLNAKERDKLILREGDILFVRSNGNPNYIARCAVFEGSVPTLFASYLIRARLNERLKIKSRFLRDLMSFPSYRSRLLKIARTTAGNYNMSTEGLRSLVFIQPPLDIQNRYLAIHQAIQRLKSRLASSVNCAEQLSHSLGASLFKEPSSILKTSDAKIFQEAHAL